MSSLDRALAEHPVVRAARKVVERHRGPGDLATLLDACDELADALTAANDEPAAAECACPRGVRR
jgi:hypothetical protein